MQELFKNENKDLALGFLYASFSGDKSIESKYNSLTNTDYQINGFSVCEVLRTSRNDYPIYMLYTIYHFMDKNGKTADIVVDPFNRMYKGSYSMFSRYAIFEESKLYSSDSYNNFIAFSDKCLDVIMKIPRITKNNDVNLYKELKTADGSILKAFDLLMMGEEDRPNWFGNPIIKISYKEKEGARNFLLTFARAQFVERYLSSPENFKSFLNDSVYSEDGLYNNRALDILNVLDIPIHEYDQCGFAKGVIGYALENCSNEELQVLFSNGLKENELSINNIVTLKDILIENFEYISSDMIISNIKQIIKAALLFSNSNYSDTYDILYNYALSRFNPEIAKIKVRQPGVFDNMVPELTYKDVCKLILDAKNLEDSEKIRILSGFVSAEDKQAYVNSHSQDFFTLFCTNINHIFRIYGKIKSYEDEKFEKNALKLICNRYNIQNLDTDAIPEKYQEMYERLIPISESNKRLKQSILKKSLLEETTDEAMNSMIDSIIKEYV